MEGSDLAAMTSELRGPVEAERSLMPGVQGARYEIANALGRLNSDRPKLGEACVREVSVAKAIRFMLHALDLHAHATGKTAEQVAHDVEKGRIEVRFDGGRFTVVCP